VTSVPTFEQLVAQGDSEPTEGWDFTWFNDRATEQRPSWKFSEALVSRLANVDAVLDVQTGGGERFSEVLSQIENRPRLVSATESWEPNVNLAKQNLERFDASVIQIADQSDFPFPDHTFELVTSRHPTRTLWSEISRVLRPGGMYFSQQVGAGTNSELTDFMMGPQPISDTRSASRASSTARSLGLDVVDLREESLPISFFDVGAVVYFLRKVIWTVPGFTVERYKERLLAMHEHIARYGSFHSHSQRFLIEARKPLDV
jgi:SAM-dependent methyltransferase